MVDLPPDELNSGSAADAGDAEETSESGPLGTRTVPVASEDRGSEELDLVEREDLPGFIVARNGQPRSSAEAGPRGTIASPIN